MSPYGERYMQYAITMGIYAGIIQSLFGIFKLGIITHFLSYPVILGFTTAAAFIIGISQLTDATGFDLSYINHRLMKLIAVLKHAREINPYTIGTFLLSIFGIIGIQKISKRVPGTLIMVVLMTLLSYFLLQYQSVSIVGHIPKDFPSFKFPNIDIVLLSDQSVTILSLVVIGIVENLSIARTLESKNTTYKIDTNQALIAIGASRAIGGFFQSMPTSGSFSRSVINDEAGAKSTISTLIMALLITLTLLFFTPYFYYLPKALLAAIIIVSIRGLIEPSEIKTLYQISKIDFVMMSVTFVTTIIAGITYGVLFGIILSLLTVLYRSSTPTVNVLGNLPETTYYRNIDRYPNANPINDILIVRFNDQLYFGNCNHFILCLEKYVEECPRDIHHLVLDASNIHFIDASGIRTIHDINKWLSEREIELHVARAIGPVKDL